VNVRNISWEQVELVWREELWPTRTSVITPVSAIVYRRWPFEYNGAYMEATPTFFGAFDGHTLAGVNSGHLTGDNWFRSRGLFVFPGYRRQGVAHLLLRAVMRQAREEAARYIWTMPSAPALGIYENLGFERVGDWFQTETGHHNCYAAMRLNDEGSGPSSPLPPSVR
jgi:GNAT superfamily N-acetyltransferase